jgi:2-oxoglutarate dehydrogenase E1 component
MAEKLKNTSYLFGSNAIFIEEMYGKYVQDPASVDKSWQQFFENFGDEVQEVVKATTGTSWAPNKARIVGYKDPSEPVAKGIPANDVAKATNVTQACTDSIKALMLIRAYKVRGHLLADLDPLKITVRDYHPDLDPATYGFTDSD